MYKLSVLIAHYHFLKKFLLISFHFFAKAVKRRVLRTRAHYFQQFTIAWDIKDGGVMNVKNGLFKRKKEKMSNKSVIWVIPVLGWGVKGPQTVA